MKRPYQRLTSLFLAAHSIILFYILGSSCELRGPGTGRAAGANTYYKMTDGAGSGRPLHS